jgi:formiminoglutamase
MTSPGPVAPGPVAPGPVAPGPVAPAAPPHAHGASSSAPVPWARPAGTTLWAR